MKLNHNPVLRTLVGFACSFAFGTIATVANAQSIEVKGQAYSKDVALPFGAPIAAQPPAAATPAVKPTPVAARWELVQSDVTLSRGLLRWAREANVQISYDAPADLPAIGVAYEGDFWTALNALLVDSANGPYPLHGCQYNNVTRVLHISQPCDR
jgi:hypothetical protein